MLFAAHAIKGEISKIQGCARLLEERLSDSESKEYSRIITHSCSDLSDMLEKAKTQLQDITIEYKFIHISEIIKRIISSYEPIAAIRGVILQHKVPDEIYLLSDANHLYNVIDNLLKNAIEALNKENGHILIMLQVLRKYLVISIEDNGCGMDPEQIKQIRKPFFTTKNTRENYGLGMTYSYSVIKKLKGRIEIESEPGEGSAIRVFLKR